MKQSKSSMGQRALETGWLLLFASCQKCLTNDKVS